MTAITSRLFLNCAKLCALVTPLNTGGDMAEGENDKICKNPACGCPAQPDGKYCSASCEGAGQTIEIDCDCGHAECGGNF